MPSISYKESSLGDRLFSNILLLLALTIIVLSGLYILEQYGFLIYLLIVMLTNASLILWHSKTRGYRCKNCGHEFEINFWNDLISAHSFKQKMLRCPDFHCKGYATELVIKRNP